MHRVYRFIIVILIIPSLTASVAFAQQPNVQKALEDTKESLGNLVAAKDEDSPFDIALRIKTFKDVIELSLSEAKDLKIKLLAFDKIDDEFLLQWKDNMITALNEAITYYEEQQVFIDENEVTIDLEMIQRLASEFKEWREEHYLTVYQQIQEFFFIQREQQALDIANRRWYKIEGDLVILEREGIKGITTLHDFLEEAGDLLLIAKDKNEEAVVLFFDAYVTPLVISTSTVDIELEIATTTDTMATTTDTMATTTEISVATTTDIATDIATTTAEVEADLPAQAGVEPIASIKDLVRSSLQNVREAYQVFIEMSNFVRKLLS